MPGTILSTETVDGFAVGRLTAKTSVGADGACRIRVPLQVPRGRAGIQPSLSLLYDSSADNGLVGVGWNLDGLPRITRTPWNFALDGEARGIKFIDGSEGDRYALNGQRLVVTGGPLGMDSPYGGHLTEYRTEEDIHVKVVSHEPDDLGPRYFKLYSRNGTITTLGGIEPENSSLTGQRIRIRAKSKPLDPTGLPTGIDPYDEDFDQKVRLNWCVSRVEDRAGNYFSVAWALTVHSQYGYEHLPTSISYTGSVHEPQRKPFSLIRLEYEIRPDRDEHYVSGVRLIRSQRLSSVQMLRIGVDGLEIPIRDYEFSYQSDSVTGRSLLNQIIEHDCKGVPLRPTKFTWSIGSTTYRDIPTGIKYGTSHCGDINGDGLDDLYYGGSYRFANGNGFGPLLAQGKPTQELSPVSQNPSPFSQGQSYGGRGRFVDIGGTGRNDFLIRAKGIGDSPPYFRNEVWRYGPKGFERVHDVYEEWRERVSAVYLIDLDGDGRYEWITEKIPSNYSEATWAIRRQGEDWFGPERLTGFSHSVPEAHSVPFRGYAVDIDGSGRSCLLTADKPATGNGWLGSAGLYLRGDQVEVQPTNMVDLNKEAIFADVNGDGLADWIFKDPSGTLNVSLNTGNGFARPWQWAAPAPFDSSTSLKINHWGDAGLRVLDYDGDGCVSASGKLTP